MALTFTLLDSGHSEVSSNTQLSNSITPGANKLILAVVNASDTVSDPGGAGTATGCGLTWVKVTSPSWQASTSRLYVFRALGAAPTTGQVTFTMANTPGFWNWAIYEVGGAVTTGTNGSGAVVQSNGTFGNSTTPTIALGAFADIANGTLEAIASTVSGTAPTVGAGFTSGVTTNNGASGDSFRVGYRTDNATTCDGTAGSGAWGIAALEIRAAVDPAAVADLWTEQSAYDAVPLVPWAFEPSDAGDVPLTSLVTTATAAQDAALWPEQPGSDRSLQPLWFDAGIGHGDWIPIPKLTVATVAQDAALWPEQPGSEASLQPVWAADDDVDEAWRNPVAAASTAQDAPLWPEQPGQEESTQPVWLQEDVEVWIPIPNLTVATQAQDAAILPEQPGSEASTQPVWAAIDAVHDFGIPMGTLPLDVQLQAPLWPEQPGSERSTQPVWFKPDEPMEGIPTGLYPTDVRRLAPLWPEQPGSERSLQPVWFPVERIFDVPFPQGHRRRRTQRVQYHLVVYGPDANGGPGTPKLELDSDALNVTWMQTLNGPGAIAFAIYRRNAKVDSIEWMVDHVKLFRETDAGLKVVFAGKLVKPVYSAIDVLAYGWDYAAFLQLSRTGYRTAYASKLIGSEVIGPEWALAKALTNSPFAFVATGTVQDPLGLDGVTAIKTNADFGMVDFNRLFAFGTVAEMAMANTTNNVKFEITRESPHTFNLWKNYGSNATDFAATSPGNLASYDFDPGYDAVRHDLATVLSDGHGGHGEYTVQSADANTTRLRRLQQALVIRTLFGVTSGTTETDQGIAALRRQLAVSARYPRSITSQPRQGEFDPFVTADMGDLQRYTLQNPSQSGDLFDGYVRLVEIVGTFAKNHGELLQLRHRYAQ